MRLLGLFASFLLACAAAAPAQAIVGPSQDGSEFSPETVMVLNHLGPVAGFCSGLVVAPTAVLTAAHCVPAGADVRVHFRDAVNKPVLLAIAAVARHPGYRAEAIKRRERSIDLALVRLASPLPAHFHPARLGDVRFAPPGTTFRLAGFGLTREGEAASSGMLRSASLVAREPVSDLLLWARDPAGRGAGACTGDSGGPVFAADTDTAVAITLWSAGEGRAACGSLTQAIWIGPQRPWIEETLREWGASSAE